VQLPGCRGGNVFLCVGLSSYGIFMKQGMRPISIFYDGIGKYVAAGSGALRS
jgi:hypothetical protein